MRCTCRTTERRSGGGSRSGSGRNHGDHRQNGNGTKRLRRELLEDVWDYQSEQTSETEAGVRQALTLDATRWQYVTGVADETLVNPEAWYHDYALISRSGNETCS